MLSPLTRLHRLVAVARRGARLLLLWPLAAALVATVGWVSLLDGLERERQVRENDALRAAATIARSYADHLSRTFRLVDQILLHVRFEWSLSRQTLRLENLGVSGLFPSTPVFNVGIVDREGRLITNTLQVNVEHVADRQYFRVQRASKSDDLYVGQAAFGRSTGRSVVHFSRRLADSNGRFLGVVRASVAPAYLTASYDEISLGDKGLLAILGNDGAIRASRVGASVYATDTSAFATSAPALRPPLSTQPRGSILADGKRWFGDGRNRYIGWQQVEGFPVVAIAGVDQQEALGAFMKTRQASLERAAAMSGLLALATLIAMALSLRLAWRKHQIELARAAYRLATEAGTEGFYIFRELRDAQGGIRDHELIDCNQTGAELYGTIRQALLGQRLSALHHGDTCHWGTGLRQRFLIAAERGVFEDDIEVPVKGAASKWYRLKFVHANDLVSLTTWDVTESKRHLSELERRGNEDPLTGLPNRHWLLAYLPNALARAVEHDSMVALLFIDLDGFKHVNDSAGHHSGDELLRSVTGRLRLAVRPADHLVRVGGDEFVVIVERLADKAAVAQFAERMLQAFGERFHIGPDTFAIGASIGISVLPDDGADMQELLTHADAAMYAVKTSGKMGYRFFDRAYFESVRAKIDRKAELEHALNTDQLILYYQPRVSVATGDTCSMEALVRWSHPTRGVLDPIDFIPLAEETGLVVQLGEVVIDKVCAQIARWARLGTPLVPVSLNVSAQQLDHSDLAAVLREAVERYGVKPELVEIELTESSMTADNVQVAKALHGIQRLGMALAVDDFGTGYSSLSQLQQLDFDVLKVDRAFTTELERTKEGSIFFTAIIPMAHALGMRVVAEGVETAGQARHLKLLCCDELQGYYFSMPLPATEQQPILPNCRF